MKIDGKISSSQMEQNWTRYMVMTDVKSLRKPVEFQEENEVQVSVPTNKTLQKHFTTVTPVEKGLQCTPFILNTPVWTEHNSLVHTGTTHYEGGWPKDIDTHDEEVTARYRRKQEKSEAYLHQMKGLTKVSEYREYRLSEIYFGGILDRLSDSFPGTTVLFPFKLDN